MSEEFGLAHPRAGKTALVLSGGGMFGAYQAGAWKTLSSVMAPDLVVGVSVGALSGWHIAAGESAAELERRWLDPKAGDLMLYRMLHRRWKSLFDPQALEATAKDLVSRLPLRMDFGLALVDLPGLRRKLVTNGDITWRHVVATCSVPVGFPPVQIEGRWFLDGGLFEPTPIWAAIAMGATRIVAVNASRFIPPPGLGLVLGTARALARRRQNQQAVSAGGPEIVMITPERPLGKMLDGANWREDRIRSWMAMGERDAAAALESIRALELRAG